MNAGFIKFLRSEVAEELMRYPTSFTLLAQIAFRARREVPKINPFNMEVGEAMIGDFATIGLTRQQFRQALDNLKNWGYVTTRATNKGTIAKLCNSEVYDINSAIAQPANQPSKEPAEEPHSNHPGNQPTNHAATTNKNDKKEEEKNDKKLSSLRSGAAKKNEPFLLVFPEWASPEFKVKWDEWLTFRQGKRDKLKPASIQKMLDKLAAFDERFCLLLFDKSITNGYTGLIFDDTPAKYEVYKFNQLKPFDPTNGNANPTTRNGFALADDAKRNASLDVLAALGI